ncbi:MAG: HU family DNA-binding protein [Betaproteobacteria bacterium]|nr:HU family DNA-binding protein [Betaproteobacteria bacterium]
MNKSELIKTISDRTGLSRNVAGNALDATIDSIVEAVSKGEQVTLVGFGSFKLSNRSARTGRNPKTGAPMKIPAASVPKFSAGSTFKAAAGAKKKK